MRKNREAFKLKDIINIFLPLLWLIILVALVCSLVLGFYSGFIAKETYTSTATMMVYKQNSETISTQDLTLATSMVPTYKNVIETYDFCDAIANDAKQRDGYKAEWNIKPETVSSSMRITQVGETEIFKVAMTTDNPEKSYLLATAVSYMIKNELQAKLPYGADIQVSEVNQPRFPAANDKHVVRNAILGFFGGAVATMICIFMYAVLDVTIHDRKKIEESFDIPVLGVIPRFVSEEDSGK